MKKNIIIALVVALVVCVVGVLLCRRNKPVEY